MGGVRYVSRLGCVGSGLVICRAVGMGRLVGFILLGPDFGLLACGDFASTYDFGPGAQF